MSVKTETLLVRKIMKSLRQDYQFDGYHVHGSALQRAGEPDIDGSVWVDDYRCLHLKIEVKTPSGKPSLLQIHRLREYHIRGYVTGIVTGYEDVKKLIEAWERYSAGTPLFPIESYIRDIPDPYNLYGETE